jgi:tRNA(fMet)-specific endonuclease VapC
MRRYLLDTNSAADCIFRRRGVHEKVKETRQSGGKIGTCIPVLAEIWAGIEYSVTRDKNRDIVNRNLRLFRLWPLSAEAAAEYGRLFAELRRAGRPMQVVDMMIAAIARTLGNCTVVSRDSDLSAVPGLKVESWSAG